MVIYVPVFQCPGRTHITNFRRMLLLFSYQLSFIVQQMRWQIQVFYGKPPLLFLFVAVTRWSHVISQSHREPRPWLLHNYVIATLWFGQRTILSRAIVSLMILMRRMPSTGSSRCFSSCWLVTWSLVSLIVTFTALLWWRHNLPQCKYCPYCSPKSKRRCEYGEILEAIFACFQPTCHSLQQIPEWASLSGSMIFSD